MNAAFIHAAHSLRVDQVLYREEKKTNVSEWYSKILQICKQTHKRGQMSHASPIALFSRYFLFLWLTSSMSRSWALLADWESGGCCCCCGCCWHWQSVGGRYTMSLQTRKKNEKNWMKNSLIELSTWPLSHLVGRLAQ